MPAETREFRIAFKIENSDSHADSSIVIDNLHLTISGPEINSEQIPANTDLDLIFSSDFEGFDSETSKDVGWSTYSEGRSGGWPWGLKRGGHSGEYSIYLVQQKEKDYWLYTGKGSLAKPPSFSNDKRLIIGNKDRKSYLLSTYVRGYGYADLYIFWYDESNEIKNSHIGRYFLPENFKLLKKTFSLPAEAKEFRVAFLLRETSEKGTELYVDDFKIEKFGR